MVVALQTLIDRSVKNMGAVNTRVKEYAIELVKRAYKEGIYVQISSGYRSNAEQQKLYNQGRTTPGNIVTNAKPGQSVHNYGYAIDFFLVSDDGNTALWVVNDKWKRVAAIGKSMGFSWGGDWKSFPDYPHLDYGGLTWQQLKAGRRPTIPPLSNVTPIVSKPVNKDYLTYDDRGHDVEMLQTYLTKVGFPVKVNGHYSAETRAGVIAFQKSRKLEADGIYGKASVDEMNKALKETDARIQEEKEAAAAAKEEKPVAEQYKKNAAPSKSLAPEFKEAVKAGITDGTYPQRPVTREEAAVMAYRASKK